MSIEKAVKKALKTKSAKGEFAEQLESNRAFSDRMGRAGVVIRKQEFSIPLMERIAHSTRG
ncbi:hypothetical protein [Croceicoccus naphthovorans]|uniref:Uncharacterized protein n=1 Tax=Croceicoccus naphthovorans TaxID=1348774 RepID=A0A0G3XDP1_9SPHN|nr:hypothetical protein [Croceicoccus naphthovorans]AKM09312.1 hypothetical protein AB433_03875 [Croceicoccus naphthovorans]MBB3990218.1 hypothetical protein [Croceicoccus naphthovorans]